jgi:hypothetical protein
VINEIKQGGEWSAVVFTRRLVENIGYFDENFYPGFFEGLNFFINLCIIIVFGKNNNFHYNNCKKSNNNS